MKIELKQQFRTTDDEDVLIIAQTVLGNWIGQFGDGELVEFDNNGKGQGFKKAEIQLVDPDARYQGLEPTHWLYLYEDYSGRVFTVRHRAEARQANSMFRDTARIVPIIILPEK
jgi:hypothetical protein